MIDMLENKFLKYSPKITPEIFKLIWNKFIEWEYDVSCGEGTIFRNFSSSWSHLLLDGKSICTRTIKPKDFEEITVQEILGYDPFVRDSESALDKWLRETKALNLPLKELASFISNSSTCDWGAVYTKLEGEYSEDKAKILIKEWSAVTDFVLPERWCVKVQSYGIPKEVEGWRGCTWCDPGYINFDKYHSASSVNEEITLDQFKQYVLKKADFKLEKDWQILATSEVIKRLQQYDVIFEEGYDYTLNAYYGRQNGLGFGRIGANPKVQIITLEQLEQYVLKETTKESKVMEKDWSIVTKEELLEEAKRRYPVGTKFKSAYSGDVCTSTDILKNDSSGVVTSQGYFVRYRDEWAEIVSLPEVKEVIPEYVECKTDLPTQFTKGKIYKGILNNDIYSIELDDSNKKNGYHKSNFKSSTKEAFDTQNKPQSTKPWSVGSYAVALKNHVNWSKTEKGDIYLIKPHGLASNITKANNSLSFCVPRSPDEFKWFATKSEAEEFVKTLIPVKKGVKQTLKQAVHCKTQEEWDFVKDKIDRDNGWEEDYPCQILVGKSNWKGSVKFCIDEGFQILSFQEWCKLNNYKMEYQFKIGSYYYFEAYSNLVPSIAQCSALKDGFGSDNWIMLRNTKQSGSGSWSFYDMNNVREATQEELQKYGVNQFIVGKWYRGKVWTSFKAAKYNGHDDLNHFTFTEVIRTNGSHGRLTDYTATDSGKFEDFVEVSLSEIQQYLPDGHPDKLNSLESFKVGDWVYCGGRGLGDSGDWRLPQFVPVFQIKEIATGYLRPEYDKADGVAAEKCRHATKEEITKYLKGCESTSTLDLRGYAAMPPTYGVIDYGIRIHQEFFEAPKSNLILTIDEEELPMVSINKTKTVQIINLD